MTNLIQETFRFENKTCVVCGPLGPIGMGILSSITKNGNTIVLVGLEPDQMEELKKKLYVLASDLQQKLEKIDIIECDVSKEEDILVTIAKLKNYEKIDAFFYNTGVMYTTSEEGPDTVKRFGELMRINTYPFIDMVEKLEPLFIAATKSGSRARVFVTGSVSGIRPRHKNYTAYAISKTCLHSYVKAKDMTLKLREEAERYSINAIAPGMFESRMTKQLGESGVENDNLAGRYGRPADIAALFMLYLSESQKDISGTVIPLDGGYLSQ